MGIYAPNSIFQRGNEIFFKNLIQVFLTVFIGKIVPGNSVANRANEDRYLSNEWVTWLPMKTCHKDAL